MVCLYVPVCLLIDFFFFSLSAFPGNVSVPQRENSYEDLFVSQELQKFFNITSYCLKAKRIKLAFEGLKQLKMITAIC